MDEVNIPSVDDGYFDAKRQFALALFDQAYEFLSVENQMLSSRAARFHLSTTPQPTTPVVEGGELREQFVKVIAFGRADGNSAGVVADELLQLHEADKTAFTERQLTDIMIEGSDYEALGHTYDYKKAITLKLAQLKSLEGNNNG